jgi:hypothetical protein
MSSEIIKTKVEAVAPRLFVSTDFDCQFCKQPQQMGYLYTRGQFYVCIECAKSLEAIMETNRRGGGESK